MPAEYTWTAAVDAVDGLHPREMRRSPPAPPAGTNMRSELLPRHLPGSAFPLQLMDFQMKGKISCALDLKIVSWILLTSS